MSKIENPFCFHQGNSPIVVSMPHSGVELLPEMEARLSNQAKSLPDTDWYIPELYDFLLSSDISVISANYSRYVIDLNRPIDDKPLYASKTTGLFPEILFSDEPVFLPGKEHSNTLKEKIKEEVWQTYHQQIEKELERVKNKFGFGILFDAHSIAAKVPMLFDGTLPDFNFGNNDGMASDTQFLTSLEDIISDSGFSCVCNGRFKGGYITRSFGQPQKHIHAIQLELSQATYLANNSDGYQLDLIKKQNVSLLLQKVIERLLEAGKQLYFIKNCVNKGNDDE